MQADVSVPCHALWGDGRTRPAERKPQQIKIFKAKTGQVHVQILEPRGVGHQLLPTTAGWQEARGWRVPEQGDLCSTHLGPGPPRMGPR